MRKATGTQANICIRNKLRPGRLTRGAETNVVSEVLRPLNAHLHLPVGRYEGTRTSCVNIWLRNLLFFISLLGQKAHVTFSTIRRGVSRVLRSVLAKPPILRKVIGWGE